MTERGYDRRLKAAMSEIQKIARRYDVALACMLVSPTHSEYAYDFPTWSPLQFHGDESGRIGLRFRAVSDQFTNQESHKAIVEAGVHLVEHLRLFGTQTAEQFEAIMDGIERCIEVERTSRKHRPHRVEDLLEAERYRQDDGNNFWSRK